MLFDKPHSQHPDRSRRYAIYELAYTFVDFSAAILFIIGSIMFFSDDWTYTGTWLFVIGSIFFAMKPTIRIVRELHMIAKGRADAVADNLNKDQKDG
jgi:hypothetical protein